MHKIIIVVLIGFGMILTINAAGRTDAHRLLCYVTSSQISSEIFLCFADRASQYNLSN